MIPILEAVTARQLATALLPPIRSDAGLFHRVYTAYWCAMIHFSLCSGFCIVLPWHSKPFHQPRRVNKATTTKPVHLFPLPNTNTIILSVCLVPPLFLLLTTLLRLPFAPSIACSAQPSFQECTRPKTRTTVKVRLYLSTLLSSLAAG